MTGSIVDWKRYRQNLENLLRFHIQWDIINDFFGYTNNVSKQQTC